MTTRPPAQELYFKWLYDQICPVEEGFDGRSYWGLADIMYEKEFTWFIPNDDNRVADGEFLRLTWLDQAPYSVVREVGDSYNEWASNMLEVMVALAQRIWLEDPNENSSLSKWFWKLMRNIGLWPYNDDIYKKADEPIVSHILDKVIQRDYAPNGEGGLFPLRNPRADQRGVEIWYQMSEYLLEHSNLESY